MISFCSDFTARYKSLVEKISDRKRELILSDSAFEEANRYDMLVFPKRFDDDNLPVCRSCWKRGHLQYYCETTPVDLPSPDTPTVYKLHRFIKVAEETPSAATSSTTATPTADPSLAVIPLPLTPHKELEFYRLICPCIHSSKDADVIMKVLKDGALAMGLEILFEYEDQTDSTCKVDFKLSGKMIMSSVVGLSARFAAISTQEEKRKAVDSIFCLQLKFQFAQNKDMLEASQSVSVAQYQAPVPSYQPPIGVQAAPLHQMASYGTTAGYGSNYQPSYAPPLPFPSAPQYPYSLTDPPPLPPLSVPPPPPLAPPASVGDSSHRQQIPKLMSNDNDKTKKVVTQQPAFRLKESFHPTTTTPASRQSFADVARIDEEMQSTMAYVIFLYRTSIARDMQVWFV